MLANTACVVSVYQLRTQCPHVHVCTLKSAWQQIFFLPFLQRKWPCFYFALPTLRGTSVSGTCARRTCVCFNKMVSWLATCLPPVQNLQRTPSQICSYTGQPPSPIEGFGTMARKMPHGLRPFKSWPSEHMDYLHAPCVSALFAPLPQWEPSTAWRCTCTASMDAT